MYRNMQSYPSHQDHMHQGPHCFPGMEAFPTQGYDNPGRPPMGYGCWPWGSGYGGASPIPNHGCCNHSYFPAYGAWGSPYSHVTTHHCPGNYPSFPVQYMPPPPNYANMPAEHHCCGCFNHPLHHREQKNVRIEEEPDKERMKDCSVAAPWLFHNSPGRIGWLPPDCSSNKEHGMAKETGDMRDGSPGEKANENGKVAAQQPAFHNGWFPLDLSNLVLPKSKGDGEGNKQDEGKRNFPYPIIWIPPYKQKEKEKEDQKGKDASIKSCLETAKGSESIGDRAATKARGIPGKEEQDEGKRNFPYPLIWIPPYKQEEKEKEDQKGKDASIKSCLETVKGSESIGDRTATKARGIPVKEAEQHVEKKTSTSKEKEGDVSYLVGKENGEKVDNGDNVPPKEGSKRKSSPQPKLPPVCLRVDPLPKRKNGNGSLRSLSPSKNKQKLDSQSNNASKVIDQSTKKEQERILPHEPKEDKITKTIKVVDGRTSPGSTMDVKSENPVKDAVESRTDVSTNQVEFAQKYDNNEVAAKSQSEEPGLAGEKTVASFRDQDMKADEVEKSCNPRLSEEEAAVIIQSAYRGFDVRRWEPLKKLKQIAEVRERIAEVKHLIQAMKSSSDIQSRSKQRSIIAETIMSLLLKLDTIQGLTLSIREARKSVVKELVSLQEQLDSLMNEEPENSAGPESSMARDEDALNRSEDLITSQNDNEINPTDVLVEAHLDHSDGGSNNGNSETTEAALKGEQASEGMGKEATASCMDKCVELAPEPTNKEDKKSNEVFIIDETIAEKDHEGLVVGLGSGVSLQEDSSSASVMDITATAHLDHSDGGSNNGNSEITEAALKGEQASEGMGKETTASCMDKCVESAPEPTDKEDKKSNEVVIVDETIAEKDHEGLVVGLGSGVSLQEDSSSPKVMDITSTDHGSELTELPIEVLDDFCAEEGPNGVLAEADASSDDQEKQQLMGALMESSIISELHETAENKDDRQPMETHEILDLPFNILDDEPDTGETSTIERPLDDKFETEEKLVVKTGNERSEPDYTVQQPQIFVSQMIEAFDEIGNHSMENEMPSHLLQVPKLKQETANSDEIGAEAKFDDEKINSDSTQQSAVAEERQPQITQACQRNDQVSVPEECNTKQTEDVEEHRLKYAGADAIYPTSVEDLPANGVVESNRQLSEENERLRNMMEKLIESGQEQLLAISCLSKRVKDLEKKVSRKKKLKVKQYRAPRSVSSCMTTYDDKNTLV